MLRKLAFVSAALLAPILHAGHAGATLADLRMDCRTGYYLNASGNCVSGPKYSNSTPAGATAICRDGTYSFSQSRRGTCSWHGGVRTWL
ncbi:MAG: DUF3761 domain-containing protein [Actinobacteria bacterium]|nr:DUF3761 domain-containing protein [Actinomycetota bacterium]